MRKKDRKKGLRKMIAKSTKRRMVAEKSNKENSNRRKPVMAVAESAYMIQDFSYGSCLGCIINLSCLCSLSGLNSLSSPSSPSCPSCLSRREKRAEEPQPCG